MSVGKEEVCEETSVCVFSISILWGWVWWYLHVAGCVLRDLGRVCSVVLSPCVGPGLVFSCEYPVCGLLVSCYASWCREISYHSHLLWCTYEYFSLCAVSVFCVNA